MSKNLYLTRKRTKWLRDEEANLAKALRGKLPPKHLLINMEHPKPKKRDWLAFYFEYFMTVHINAFRVNDKLWCDGARIDKVIRSSNRYYMEGLVYILPEAEEQADIPAKYKTIEDWRGFPFKGYFYLHPDKDLVSYYRFTIKLNEITVSRQRKI